MYTHIHTYTHINIHSYIQTCTHTNIHTRIQTNTHTCTHTHTYTHTAGLINIHAWTQIHICWVVVIAKSMEYKTSGPVQIAGAKVVKLNKH